MRGTDHPKDLPIRSKQLSDREPCQRGSKQNEKIAEGGDVAPASEDVNAYRGDTDYAGHTDNE
jgi:hypothetical protein